MISQSVKDALSEGPGEPLLDLGRLRFKNDDRPFRAFALGGGHVPPRPREIGTLPSIAVLPLVNLSGDEADAYLAAGVVDDVIQSLGGAGGHLARLHRRLFRAGRRPRWRGVSSGRATCSRAPCRAPATRFASPPS